LLSSADAETVVLDLKFTSLVDTAALLLLASLLGSLPVLLSLHPPVGLGRHVDC
jgi:anti-anti-sigma regulatory factor